MTTQYSPPASKGAHGQTRGTGIQSGGELLTSKLQQMFFPKLSGREALILGGKQPWPLTEGERDSESWSAFYRHRSSEIGLGKNAER